MQHHSAMPGTRQRRPNWLALWRSVVAGVAALGLAPSLAWATNDSPSIEVLLKSGWQIAGYSQAFDNRSTFILFRHPDQTYLVQCRVGYDVTRTPSVYSICYELR